MATLSRDLRFDLGRVEGYRNFCNKLWNAARFVLHGDRVPTIPDGTDDAVRLRSLDPVAPLGRRFARSPRASQSYRFDLAAQAIYEFTWYEFCDWYLEFSKTVLQSDGEHRRTNARHAAHAGRDPGDTCCGCCIR